MSLAWPKKSVSWIEDRTLHVSIPFTWELPKVRGEIQQKSFLWDDVVVGGPAVFLMPGYFEEFSFVRESDRCDGVLQRVNPLATRTTEGCIRNCQFCGVKKIYPQFRELSDWPDLPIICDDNLLASSREHFEKVIYRLRNHDWVDIQGVDARLLTPFHANRFATLPNPILRMALDHDRDKDAWKQAYEILRGSGIAKHKIRTYVLIAFDSDPDECWERCEWIESFGVKALPLWFHTLDSLEWNVVTKEQQNLGWNDFERRRIMQWFYQHRDIYR